MLQFTRQQLDKKWDALPINLREVLCSPDHGKIIWDICEANHLADEKIGKIAKLAGYVILGLLHSEDLALEIKKELGFIPELANLIASEIDRKIFTSIRSEIEKVYAPAEALAEEGAPLAAEETIKEIQYKEVEPPEIKSQSWEVQPPKVEPEPPIKIIGFEEEKKEIQFQEVQLPHGEVEPPKIEAEPLIIHEETELKPLSESKKSFKSLGGLFGFLSASRRKKKEEEKPSPVKAEIEGIGFSKEIKEIIKEFKPIETKIKVVDYTEVPETSGQPTTDNEQLTTDEIELPVVSKVEPPIKIIDSIRGTPEFIEAVEADKRRIREVEPPKVEIEPKKKFFSKLSGFFTKKAKIETEAESEIEKVEEIK